MKHVAVGQMGQMIIMIMIMIMMIIIVMVMVKMSFVCILVCTVA